VGEVWTLCGLVKGGFGYGPLTIFVWNFGGMQRIMLYEKKVMQMCVETKEPCVYHVVEFCFILFSLYLLSSMIVIEYNLM
jgi:hypothetical protein